MMMERLTAITSHPLLRLPWLLWDAAMLLTGNASRALQLYHEMSAEILENLR